MKKTYEKSNNGWWIIGAVVVAFVALLILSSFQSGVDKTNREVALSCTTDAFTTFHIHPHLTIIVDGVQQTIPADIGITLACMHPIHTHDTSGTIHIESPQQRDFTLGDFFAVWGQPFSQNQILNYTADASHTITETVNSTTVQTFENTILHDKDNIVITYQSGE